jgi:predicted glycosyltransferase
MTFVEEEGLRAAPSFTVRFADEVALPDAVGMEALSAFRPAPRRFVRYPGFREEYYLHDVSPDPEALQRLVVDERHVVGVVRPARPVGSDSPGPSPGEEALAALVRAVAGRRNVTLVLLARDREQRQRLLALGVAGVLAPEGHVDSIGLIAAADFVLGDGGIMTREAAALGTPAYTVAKSVLTAVDRSLLKAGRLRLVTGPDDLSLKKKDSRTATLEPRDPQVFVDELLALASDRPRRSRAGGLAGADRGVP